MADVHDKETRRRNMAAIKGKDTKPELTVRRHLRSLGLGYRKNYPGLPGRPDIVLTKYKTVIFVNGCFWHRHPGCRFATVPQTNRDFWLSKFTATVERDQKKTEELRSLGWRVITVWECGVNDSQLHDLLTSITGNQEDHQ